jgi:hypothetical protein
LRQPRMQGRIADRAALIRASCPKRVWEWKSVNFLHDGRSSGQLLHAVAQAGPIFHTEGFLPSAARRLPARE